MEDSRDDERRPRQLEAAEEELRRRRERGKLSQRAFRKRQSRAVSDMREENERLKVAIEELVEAAACNDRPELRQAIRKTALIAGVDTRALDGGDGDAVHARNGGGSASGAPLTSPGTSTTPSSSSSSSSSLSSPPENLSSCPTVTQPSHPASTHDHTAISTARSKQSPLAPPPPPGDPVLGPPDFYPALAHPTGRLSPRLDYGLWFQDDSCFVRLVDPPLDIVPYLGEGMYTLAGRIAWACAEYLVGVCRRVSTSARSGGGRMAMNPEAALRDYAEIQRIIQHSPPLHDVRYIKAMAEARLEFRRRGYVLVPRDSSPGAGDADVMAYAGNRDSGTLLQCQVEADYAGRGQDTCVWVTGDEVAQHVRAQIGDQAFARLENVLRYHDNLSHALGHSSSSSSSDDRDGDGMYGQTYALLRLLIQNLAESFICFGDGPRWRADRVAALFAARDWET